MYLTKGSFSSYTLISTAMSDVYKVLIVEDVPSDADLAEREVSKVLSNRTFNRVETREAFIAALQKFQPDLIISDYQMPSFNGMAALKITPIE